MPAGDADTLPLPVTDTVTATWSTKFAVTLLAALIATTQVLDAPVHAPLQPVNAAPADGAATSVTLVPSTNLALQAVLQLRPAGVDVTMPLPITVAASA